MSHYKSNELKIDDVRKKYLLIKGDNNQKRALIFISLFKKIYDKYHQRLKDENSIDYDDMIIDGRKGIINEGYKYILVDEFQDISQARSKLLQKIQKENRAKLYCVGDDWQAINGFAGADLKFFLNPETYFGKTIDRSSLEVIPPPSKVTNFLKWIIPALILAAFAFGIGKNEGRTFNEILVAWVLPNSVASALLTAIGGGKVLSIITAFISSPITSLNPLIGSGLPVGYAGYSSPGPNVVWPTSTGAHRRSLLALLSQAMMPW